MTETLYTSDAAHLRAQLAALAEEHEALTISHDIKDANLALLVEKVTAFGAARDVVIAAYDNGSNVDSVETQCASAESACVAMLDLARSLDQ